MLVVAYKVEITSWRSMLAYSFEPSPVVKERRQVSPTDHAGIEVSPSIDKGKSSAIPFPKKRKTTPTRKQMVMAALKGYSKKTKGDSMRKLARLILKAQSALSIL